jgi:hypothetical protein
MLPSPSMGVGFGASYSVKEALLYDQMIDWIVYILVFGAVYGAYGVVTAKKLYPFFTKQTNK